MIDKLHELDEKWTSVQTAFEKEKSKNTELATELQKKNSSESKVSCQMNRQG